MKRTFSKGKSGNRIFLMLFAGFFILLLSATSLHAQGKSAAPSSSQTAIEEGSNQPGLARIDSQKRIWLDPTQPVQTSYKVDMSHLGYATKSAAQSFFNSYSSQSVQFSVVDNKTLTLQLDIDPTNSSWTVTDWNNHFAAKASALKTSNK